MKRTCLFVLTAIATSYFAWPDHASFENAVTNALANKTELVSPMFVNQLNAFITSTGDTNDWAPATILLRAKPEPGIIKIRAKLS